MLVTCASAMVVAEGGLPDLLLVATTLVGLAVSIGGASALLMALMPPVQPWLLPILVLGQTIPVFALAPLLVLWFGYGLASKVVMAILIIYFAFVLGIGFALKRYMKTSTDFFLSGHSIPAWIAGLASAAGGAHRAQPPPQNGRRGATRAS